MPLLLIIIAAVVAWLVAGLIVVALCVTAAEGDRHLRREARRARRNAGAGSRERVTPRRFVSTR